MRCQEIDYQIYGNDLQVVEVSRSRRNGYRGRYDELDGGPHQFRERETKADEGFGQASTSASALTMSRSL